MATLPQEFIDLAAELIGDEFAEFAVSTVINKRGNITYQNPTGSVVATSTFGTIPIDYSEEQFNGELVKIGDIFVVGEYQLLSFRPSTDNCEAIRDSINYEIKSVKIHPEGNANGAIIILHMRPK